MKQRSSPSNNGNVPWLCFLPSEVENKSWMRFHKLVNFPEMFQDKCVLDQMCSRRSWKMREEILPPATANEVKVVVSLCSRPCDVFLMAPSLFWSAVNTLFTLPPLLSWSSPFLLAAKVRSFIKHALHKSITKPGLPDITSPGEYEMMNGFSKIRTKSHHMFDQHVSLRVVTGPWFTLLSLGNRFILVSAVDVWRSEAPHSWKFGGLIPKHISVYINICIMVYK